MTPGVEYSCFGDIDHGELSDGRDVFAISSYVMAENAIVDAPPANSNPTISTRYAGDAKLAPRSPAAAVSAW
jgi:hypothetical protein